MKKKAKFIAIALITTVLVSGCGARYSTATPASYASPDSETVTTDSYVNTVTTDSQSIETTTGITETPTAPSNSKNYDDLWQTASYTYTDKDGYEIEQIINMSPMVYLDDTDTVNAIWGSIGGTIDELPSVDDCYKWRPVWKDEEDKKPLCVFGTIEVKNKTNGFSFSLDNEHSVNLWYLTPFDADDQKWIFDDRNLAKPGELIVGHFTTYETAYGHEITMIFYSNGTKNYCGSQCCGKFDVISLGNASMSRDTWGPVRFCLMFPNKKTPLMPDGYEVYKHMGFYFGEKGDNPIRLSIVGEDGTIFTPGEKTSSTSNEKIDLSRGVPEWIGDVKNGVYVKDNMIGVNASTTCVYSVDTDDELYADQVYIVEYDESGNYLRNHMFIVFDSAETAQTIYEDHHVSGGKYADWCYEDGSCQWILTDNVICATLPEALFVGKDDINTVLKRFESYEFYTIKYL